MKYAAEAYAAKFGVHVKTILRIALNEKHPSDWAPGQLDSLKVANAFGMKEKTLLKVMAGEENLVGTEDAAKLMGVSLRQFNALRSKGRGIKEVANGGRTIRYLESEAVTFGL